nr:uncharacterized protein LOC117278147 [Nicotiana tomentosiformis]
MITLEETINHLFATSETTKRIWTTIATPLKFQPQGSTIFSIINQWWSMQAKNSIHKFLLQITPIMICWKLWKARCEKKYGNKSISTFRICQQVLFQAKVSSGKKYSQMDWEWPWSKVCQVVEAYKPKIQSLMVKWDMPKGDAWKPNTDESSMVN